MTMGSYVLAKLALVAFGLFAAFHPSVRRFHWSARLSAAFAAGTLVLTLHALFLSAIRVQWTLPSLALPLLALSVVVSRLFARRPSLPHGYLKGHRGTTLLGWILIGGGWMYALVALIATRATSADYVYFWGSKAVRFARAGGIDVSLLRDPFMMHLRGLYPPLVPASHGWGVIVDGEMRWSLALIDTALWLIAGTLLLRGIITASVSANAAMRIVPFWTVAMSASLIASYSGGNAEGPLVFFVSIAAASLFIDRERGAFLTGLALAGAVLTKVEGTLMWALLLGAMLVVHFAGATRISRVKALASTVAPLLSMGTWWGFQRLNQLELTDPMRQDVLDLRISQAGLVAITMLQHMATAALGLPWIIPLLVLALAWREWRRGLGFVIPAGGLLTFYFVYYLHERRTLDVVMSWEIPRITQPALALLVLGAGIALHFLLAEHPAESEAGISTAASEEPGPAPLSTPGS